jgi:hypothetical protein
MGNIWQQEVNKGGRCNDKNYLHLYWVQPFRKFDSHLKFQEMQELLSPESIFIRTTILPNVNQEVRSLRSQGPLSPTPT